MKSNIENIIICYSTIIGNNAVAMTTLQMWKNIQNYTNYVFVVKNAYNFVILYDENQLLWRYVINIMNFFDNKWITWEKLVSY